MKKLKQIIEWLLIIFTFLIPWQARWIYELGVLKGSIWEYGTKSIFITELLLGVIIIFGIVYTVWLLKTKTRTKEDIQKGKKNLLWGVLIFAGMIANGLLAYNMDLALHKMTYLILGVALAFLFIVIRPNFIKIAWAIILSAFIQSAFAINQFVAQRVAGSSYLGVADQTVDTLGAPVILLSDGTRWLRSFGTLPHPNILAGFLLISLFFIIGLIIITKNKRHQKILPLLFVVNFIGLITTASRAALVAFAICIILMTFFAAKDKLFTKQTSKFTIISIFILILFAVSFPDLIQSRVNPSNRLEEISNQSRVQQYQEFGPLIKNNFMSGVGIGNYTYYQHLENKDLFGYQLQPIHNTYLLIIAELGLIGLISILLFFFYLYRSIKTFKTWSPEMTVAMTSLLALGITALFDHYLWSFWFGICLFAIIISLTYTTNNKN